MPELSHFFGIWIGMYYREHPPPHFHVWHGGQEGTMDVRTLQLTEGHLSPRALGLVVEWASLHRAELLANWDRARRRLPLNRIAPLGRMDSMSRKVVHVKVLRSHRLALTFDDGVEGEVNLREYVPFDGVFEPLNDPAYVAKVRVNRMFGTPCWPNGADLDPVQLYAHVTGTALPKWAMVQGATGRRKRPASRPAKRMRPSGR